MADIQMIDRGDGVRLATRFQPGIYGPDAPTVVFMPGYMSDMSGTKAVHLLDWAKRTGNQCLLLDYSGCGASEGAFDDGTIKRWALDVKQVADALGLGRLLPVGSSMGGWAMVQLALLEPARVAGLVGIAAAPDFTRWGLDLAMEDMFKLAKDGFINRPSDYADSPYRYSRAFIEEAAESLVLEGPIALDCPVRLLHGEKDAEVPPSISQRLMARLQSSDVQLTVVKGGDHRLSSPATLTLLEKTIEGLIEGLKA